MQVRRYIALGSTLIFLCVSARAAAQSSEELDRARGLFQEALSLEVAGDYRTALAKLQQVSKVRLTPQVRYHLARCKEYLGRLTEALGDYRVAATEARTLGLPEIEEFERARSALEAKIPKILLHISGASGKTAVELDGVRLGPSVLGSPIAVDPGPRKNLRVRRGVVGQLS
ncbi:MAG: CDC27 family protein [Polyangiaceae bacterium]